MVQDRYQYEEEFQLGILALMVQDAHFAVNYAEVIRPVFFSNEYAQDLCEIIQDFIAQYSSVPTQTAFIEEVKKFTSSELKKSFRDFYVEVGNDLYTTNIEQDKDYVKSEVIRFGRKAALRQALLKITDTKLKLLDNGEFDKMQDIWTKAFMIGLGTEDTGYDYIDETKKRCEQYGLPIEMGIPTGLPELDRYFEGGGVHPGWFGFIMAPTGVGKSITLSTMAKHAVFNRLKVLYVSTEMTEKQLAKRLDGMVTGINLKELKNNQSDVIKKIEGLKALGGRLKIHFFPKKTANTNKLKAALDKYKSMHNFVPDIIFIDYADEMIPNVSHKVIRIDQMHIFIELNSLAQQLQVPLWTATQANGESYRLQREKKNLDLDNAGESKSKVHGADIVLSLVSVEKNDDGTGILQMGIIKNREGQAGITLMCDIDYKNMNLTIANRQIAAAKEAAASKETAKILQKFSSVDSDKEDIS